MVGTAARRSAMTAEPIRLLVETMQTSELRRARTKKGVIMKTWKLASMLAVAGGLAVATGACSSPGANNQQSQAASDGPVIDGNGLPVQPAAAGNYAAAPCAAAGDNMTAPCAAHGNCAAAPCAARPCRAVPCAAKPCAARN